MNTAYILAAYRTPGCRAKKGFFKDMRPDELAAIAISGLIERTGIDPLLVDDVILGCAFPEAEQGMNVARIAASRAGLPYQVPGMTINRFCSSGLQSIAIAAERIVAGAAECIVAGGTESMTMIPMGGNKYSANPGLLAQWPEAYASMGNTAELLAEKYAISREDQDRFAVASHQKAAAAIEAGYFSEEIIPVEIEKVAVVDNRVQKELQLIAIDDGVRPETSLEGLARLKPAFRVDGTVTAGNASQMTDGAAVALVVSESFLKRVDLRPVARFVAFAVCGVPPEVMGIGPVEAVPAALKRAGLTAGQLDLVELNEAFAVQALAVQRDLALDPDKVNVNGGAIALGHPLGCTGAKLTATLLNELGRRQQKYGVVTMCVGGGMGAAGVFEAL